MTLRTCSIEGCGRRHTARGLCNTHYEAARQRGELVTKQQPTLAGTTVEEKLRLNHVVSLEGCWRFTGGLSRDGYGRVKVGGRSVRAHRLAYELFVGPIPPGLTIDHVRARGCIHRDCINPAHLEPVTHAENVRRRSDLRPYDQPTVKRPQCGTANGYNVHRWHHEDPCDACADANTAYKRLRRQAVR